MHNILGEFVKSSRAFCKGRTAKFMSESLSKWLLRCKTLMLPTVDVMDIAELEKVNHVLTSAVSAKHLKDLCELWMKLVGQVVS